MIDWVTVIAQIINFVILAILLKIFLYDRILGALDKRKAAIREQFDDAERKQAEAGEQAEGYRRKKREFDDRHDELMRQARDDAEQLREERTRQAERDVSERKRQWLASLDDQREAFVADLRRQAAERLGDLAAKVLADLADADLQQRAVEVFLRHLDSLDEATRQDLREAVAGDGTLEVATAFDLPDKQAKRLRDAVGALAGGKAEVRFVTDGALVCGLQLRAGGRALGWNIAEYAGELADAINEAIDEQVREMRQAEAAGGEAKDAEAEEAQPKDAEAEDPPHAG
ncbi:MAG: hypothetical protein ACOC95_04720 [Planctomycetota bacterium]